MFIYVLLIKLSIIIRLTFGYCAAHKKHVQLNELITLTIRDVARSGSGVAQAETGQMVFVPFTAPGDIVEVRIEEIEKRYCTGRVEKVVTASPLRIAPLCPVFTRCGGCEWQHLSYETQWNTKISGLKHALERMQLKFDGAIEEIPAEQIWNYRNRIQLRGFGQKIGFFGRGSKDLVAIDSCPIARTRYNTPSPLVSKPRERRVDTARSMGLRTRLR
jgi:23S rRNA (uracil1939-C5)-methyltransferase